MDPNYSLKASNFLLGLSLGPSPFGKLKASKPVNRWRPASQRAKLGRIVDKRNLGLFFLHLSMAEIYRMLS